nr:hypothetical protein CFP56_37104 [Quercus suber]
MRRMQVHRSACVSEMPDIADCRGTSTEGDCSTDCTISRRCLYDCQRRRNPRFWAMLGDLGLACSGRVSGLKMRLVASILWYEARHEQKQSGRGIWSIHGILMESEPDPHPRCVPFSPSSSSRGHQRHRQQTNMSTTMTTSFIPGQYLVPCGVMLCYDMLVPGRQIMITL